MEINNYIKNKITSISILGNKMDLIIKEIENIKSIKNLFFDNKELDLSKSPELKSLHLLGSKINKIIIQRENQIKEISIISNRNLKFFNFENLNNETISSISIWNNPTLKFNIDVFSKFINLKYLTLINSDCYGSLISLKDLKKLDSLSIYNTKIIPSYEYLNNEIKIFLPINKKKIEKDNLNNEFLIKSNKKEFYKGVLFFKIDDFKNYNLKLFKNAEIIINFQSEYQNIYNSWKEVFSFLNKSFLTLSSLKKKNYKNEKDKILIKKINSLIDQIIKNKILFNAFFNENLGFRHWLEEKMITIDKLKRENLEYYQKFIEYN